MPQFHSQKWSCNPNFVYPVEVLYIKVAYPQIVAGIAQPI